MAMKEADQLFENLENMIRQRAPEAMEEEQKRLDVESQELSKVFEIYKFPPKAHSAVENHSLPPEQNEQDTATLPKLEMNLDLRDPSDPAFASAVVEIIRSIGKDAVIEATKIINELGQPSNEKKNQLRTLERWRRKAQSWRFSNVVEPIDEQINEIKELAKEQIKMQGTARAQKNAPYDKALARITEMLERAGVDYAPDLAAEALWHSGYSNMSQVDVLLPRRTITGEKEVQGARQRLRTKERSTLQKLKIFQKQLPKDHYLFGFFTKFITQEERRIKLSPQKRGQIAEERRRKIRESAKKGGVR